MGLSLTAASVLGRQGPGCGPHLVYLPEIPFSTKKFCRDVKKTYQKHGRCLIAVSEGIKNRKGMPNPFRLAVIARHHFDVARLPVVPHALQRAALAPGAVLGRALGYTATYEPGAGLPATA